MKNIIQELQWRGLVHNIIPGTEEQLIKEMTTAYIGFDPTSDSLHIGSLVPIILLKHLHNFGHKPIALIGGATGMIGDPSGKSEERNLLNEETLTKNINGIKNVLSKFLDFDGNEVNTPLLLNNFDWMKNFSFIDFVREVGKNITVNYMLSKDSVKNRIDGEGMSFTEFTYQLLQGNDFNHLFRTHNCLLQMGGSDQWGNITTGTELIRKTNDDAKVFAMTCPLITKADGTKFGKSEEGNVWLTKDKTSVFKFFQFWSTVSDIDAEKFIKIFTFLDKETCDDLIEQHRVKPSLRILQKKLAEEVTTLVHGKEELEKAIKTSNILFGNSTTSDLLDLDDEAILSTFEGVKQSNVEREHINDSIGVIDLFRNSGFIASNNEVRRALLEGSLSVNKEKIGAEFILTDKHLINDKFVLLQRGKRNYFLLKVID